MGILTKHPVMAKRSCRYSWSRVTLVLAMFVLSAVQESSATDGTAAYDAVCEVGSTEASKICVPGKFMKCISGTDVKCGCEATVSAANSDGDGCDCVATEAVAVGDSCVATCTKATEAADCTGAGKKACVNVTATASVCSTATGCGDDGTCKKGETCTYKSATESECKCGTAATCGDGQTCTKNTCVDNEVPADTLQTGNTTTAPTTTGKDDMKTDMKTAGPGMGDSTTANMTGNSAPGMPSVAGSLILLTCAAALVLTAA